MLLQNNEIEGILAKASLISLGSSMDDTVYFINNKLTDTSFTATSTAYLLDFTEGNLQMNGNVMYHSQVPSSINKSLVRGIKWQGCKIESAERNNILYKEICDGPSCIQEKDGVYFTTDWNYKVDLYFQVLGYGCSEPLNCPLLFIPYFMEYSDIIVEKLDGNPFLIIDPGIELTMKYSSIIIGKPGDYTGEGGFEAIGEQGKRIKIFMNYSNINLSPTTISYDASKQKSTAFKYVDFINTMPYLDPQHLSTIIYSGKHPVQFEYCSFDALHELHFSYSDEIDEILPNYFYPNAIFRYCIFENFQHDPTTFVNTVFAIASDVIIDYCTFNNNPGVVAASSNAKVRLHHSNMDDTNNEENDKIVSNGIIDARWNYWENDIPEEKDLYNTALSINPWYLQQIDIGQFHIEESHIDLLKYYNGDSNKMHISMRPSAFSSGWKITAECDGQQAEVFSVPDDVEAHEYSVASLSGDILYCSGNNSCNCILQLYAPQASSTPSMQASVDIAPSEYNEISDPTQSLSVSDELDINGSSSSSYKLYYSEFPTLLRATQLSQGPFPVSVNLSEYPTGSAYFILETDESPTTRRRYRHVIVGSGRPTIEISKQQINTSPGSGDLITFTISSQQAAGIELEICHMNYGSACYTAFTTIPATQGGTISMEWHGVINKGMPEEQAPSGVYRVKIILIPTESPSEKYIYYPSYTDFMDWKHFELYTDPQNYGHISLYDELGLIKLDYVATKPVVADVWAGYWLQYPHFGKVYNDVPMYALGEGTAWTFGISGKASLSDSLGWKR